MNLQELKEKERKWIDREYNKFINSGLTQKEYFKKQEKKEYAIFMKEKKEIQEKKKLLLSKFSEEIPKFSMLHFYGVKYESFEKEQEYFNTYYK